MERQIPSIHSRIASHRKRKHKKLTINQLQLNNTSIQTTTIRFPRRRDVITERNHPTIVLTARTDFKSKQANRITPSFQQQQRQRCPRAFIQRRQTLHVGRGDRKTITITERLTTRVLTRR